jgi:hypothetical protein
VCHCPSDTDSTRATHRAAGPPWCRIYTAAACFSSAAGQTAAVERYSQQIACLCSSVHMKGNFLLHILCTPQLTTDVCGKQYVHSPSSVTNPLLPNKGCYMFWLFLRVFIRQ